MNTYRGLTGVPSIARIFCLRIAHFSFIFLGSNVSTRQIFRNKGSFSSGISVAKRVCVMTRE